MTLFGCIRRIRRTEDISQTDELIAAAFTGGFTGFVTTPLDVIKTKIMMQSAGAAGGLHGIADACYG